VLTAPGAQICDLGGGLTTPGTYWWTTGGPYAGGALYQNGVEVVGLDGMFRTFVQTIPSLTTVAGPSFFVPIGSEINDTATITGTSPTGTITFNLYGPDDVACAGPSIFTDVVSVDGNGDYLSDGFQPTELGEYRWTAEYSGDNDNTSAAETCNAFNELNLVEKATPGISTQASANVALGGSIRDTATLSGGLDPGGTVTFRAYGPDNSGCAGAPAFTSTVPVASRSAESASFIPVQPGEYRWTAEYSGDAKHNAATSGCNAANESVTVSKASPSLSTQASADVVVGGQIRDTATLAGGQGPTGTIIFRAYGPNDVNCSGVPAFTDTVPVSGNGPHESGAFSPTQPGDYRWVAEYSGDANNEPAASPCNAPNERVTVAPFTDDTPPQTTIKHVPNKPHAGISFFTFRSSERGSKFRCSLDGRRFRRCTSPHRLPALAPGRHTFKVFAIDRAGNRDLTPARASFFVKPKR
jgi:hypothetical protein